MDAAQIEVLAGGAALIVFTLWFFFGGQRDETPASSNGAALYACPMHPWIASTQAPANCSICGMKLVKRD